MTTAKPIVEPTRLLWQKTTNASIGGVDIAGFIRHSGGVQSPRLFGRYAVVYVIDGEGYYGDQRGFQSPVRCGDLIFVFPEMAHNYGPGPGQRWSEFYIVFQGPIFDAWRAPGLLDIARPITHLDPTQYWLRKLQSIVEPGSDLTVMIRMQQFLADVFDNQRRIMLGESQQRWLANAQHLMNALETYPPLLPQLAAQRMKMPYEMFRRKFAQLAGIAPGKYRDARLIDLASRLLHDRHQTLRQIAEHCGFCDEFHFSRRFKQKIGLSPTEFRGRIA